MKRGDFYRVNNCDELISFPKSILTDYVGTLSDGKMELVNSALRIALAIG